MGSNSLITSVAFAQKELNRILEQQARWMRSPAYQRMLAEQRARWKARPWYERALIRTSAKVQQGRIWLGEKIAGRSFDDE